MKMYHISLCEQDVGEYAILTGDPGRVERISACLESPQMLAQNREYTSAAGTIAGQKVNVLSVGIGGPSMAIGVEELFKLGCRHFIRVGTCGGIALPVKSGDLVVANACVRQEGTGLEYLPLTYPAVADFAVTCALKAAAEQTGQTVHAGVVQSKDSFYGEMEPERMPLREQLQQSWEIYKRTGVLASEMECAALFLVSAALGAKAGAVLLPIWNEERRKALGDHSQCHQTEKLYQVAVNAIRTLIEAQKKDED